MIKPLAAAACLAAAVTGQWCWAPVAETPHQRRYALSIFEPQRARVSLFAVGPTSSAWEWTGSRWIRSARREPRLGLTGPSIAHDTHRGRTVLFAGWGPPTTWEWSGDSWVETVSGNLAVHAHSAMAYDPLRREVVMFGGLTSNGPVGTTWTWDGQMWSTRVVAAPPPRFLHDMAFDPGGGRIVMFGGWNHTGYFDDTWAWDGSGWTRLSPPVGPPARGGHRMATDSRGERVLMVGGKTQRGDLPMTVWQWSGGAWSERTSAVLPPGREGHTVAFDDSRRELLVFGGERDNVDLADTWSWDDSGWREHVTGPAPRFATALATDTQRDVVWLFGGRTVRSQLHSPTDETWRWDGFTWSPISTVTRPPGAERHRLAFDPIRGEVIHVDDWTWRFDGSDWHRGPLAPTRREGYGLTFDHATGRTLLFGGAIGATRQNDTWAWDGSSWTELQPSTRPGPRRRAALGSDPVRRHTVLFGGDRGGPAYLNDTWVWNGTTWSEAAPTVVPDPGGHPELVFDADVGRLVLVVDSSATATTRAWEWTGGDWAPRTMTAPFPIHAQAATAFDPVRRRVMMIGGMPFHGFVDALADTMLLAASPAQVEAYGSGCRSGSLELEATGRPLLGRMDYTLDCFGADRLAVFVISLRAASLSVGDCTLLHDPAAVVHTALESASATGVAHTRLSVPFDTRLVGLDLFCQAASVDAGPLGFTLSRGLRLRVGE